MKKDNLEKVRYILAIIRLIVECATFSLIFTSYSPSICGSLLIIIIALLTTEAMCDILVEDKIMEFLDLYLMFLAFYVLFRVY